MRRLIAFIALGRPLFLAGGVVMHALGVAMALYEGATLNLTALVWGQIAITSIQWMTQYSNEYFDFQADRNNRTPTNWSGGSRVLLGGEIAPKTALLAALSLAVIAVWATFVLVFVAGAELLTLALIGLGMALAWFYSAPPLRLHSRGLGELTTAIIVPLLVPLTGYSLQIGRLDALPLLAILPLCCFQFAMMLSIEFPDAEGDRASGKGTLVVRLGAKRAARLYVIVLAVGYAILPLLVLAGVPILAALAVGLTLPLGALQIYRMLRSDYRMPERWNSLAFGSIALLIASGVVMTFAFVALVGTR